MKKLLSYLRPYTGECIIAPLLKCAEALVDLFVPLLIARLIDEGITGGDRSVIGRVGLLLFLLAVAGLALAMIAQWFSARAAVGFAGDVRSALFRKIQSFSFSVSDKLGSGTLITRLTGDIQQTQTGINMALRLLLRSPFIVFGSLIMAYRVDRRCALIFLIVIPLLAAVVYGVMWVTVPLYKKVQAELDKVLRITRENLTGVRVIRAFNLQDSESDRFSDRNETLTARALHVGRISALTNPLTYLLINLATVLLIDVGAIRVDAGDLTTGQLVALLNYMGQILVELVKLANLIVTITKAIASAGRIAQVMDRDPGMTFGASAFSGSEPAGVEFRDVSLQYSEGADASLSHITFSVEPSQTVGIIGGTGSGKTSLVSLIPRFYDATSGTVLVGGRDVREYSEESLRGAVGTVFQKAELLSGTVRSNLLCGNDGASEQDLWDALEAAQASSFVKEKPLGLDDPVEQGGRNLSGGQRQRLTIARALVRKPSLLILDDSFSALDLATEASLRAQLSALPFHPTLFLVSQRVSSLRNADRILVLAEGEMVGFGTHADLVKTCPVYREICQSQSVDTEEIGGELHG